MEELQAASHSRIVQEKFEVIGIKYQEIAEIFRLLDYSTSGRIELNRFAASCRELVGGAKRRDIAQIEVTVGSLTQHLNCLETRFGELESDISGLHSLTDNFIKNTVNVLTGFDGKSVLA